MVGRQIERKKNFLLQEREFLVSSIKEKYPELFVWLMENEVDLHDLRKYSASIAAALLITLAGFPPEKASKPQLVPIVKIIDPRELQTLPEDKRALLVWHRYGAIINRASTKYEVDPGVILATIMTESGGNTYAIRNEPQINDASYGLGQILYGTAVNIGFEGTPDKLYDPETNIELIARYHKRNLTVYGDLTPQQLATAYNAGSPYNYALPGHVGKFNKWYDKSKKLIEIHG